MEAIYFITCLALTGLVYLYPKNKNPLNGTEWIFYSIFTLFCITSFNAFFLVLIRLPANLISMSLFNLIWVALLAWRMFQREKNNLAGLKNNAGKKRRKRQAPEPSEKHNFQNYQFSFRDIAVAVVLACVTVWIAVRFFRVPFNINYETSDPSVHFKLALNLYQNSTFKYGSMDFHFSNLGMMLKILAPVVSYFDFYKIFILFDIFILYLSAMFFYFSVFRFAKNNISFVITLALCVLYMMGYPLNSMIFGFEYLSTVIVLILFSIMMMDLFIQGEYEHVFLTGLMFFVFMGIFNSYYMFVPVVYLAAFLCMLLFYRKHGVFQKKCILTVSISLFLPAILGLLFYVIIPQCLNGRIAASIIGSEGYIYKELYADFIVALPLAIYGMVHTVRSKGNSYSVELTFFLIVFMIVFLIFGLHGKVSSYYYYKNNYIFWAICFYFAAIGVNKLLGTVKPMAYAYIGVWAGIILLIYTPIETVINSQNLQFDPVKRSENYFPVYSFNETKIKQPSNAVSMDRFNLYRKAKSYYRKNGETVPLLSNSFEQCLWYNDLTGAYANVDGSNNYPDLTTRYNQWRSNAHSEYLVCLKQKETTDVIVKLKKYTIVYENNAGYIFKK